MQKNMESDKESTEAEPKKWKNRKRILPAILVSISIPLILCVALPFEIYSNNIWEFLFDIWDFLPLCIAIGVLVTAVILCVLLFVPERLYKIYSLIVLVFALLLFLQGNYLNAGLNSLAGDNLGNGSTSVASKIINLIIWLVLIGGAVGVSFIKDKKGIIGIVSIVLSVVIIIAHLVIPVFAIFSNDDIFMSKDDKLSSGDGTDLPQFMSTKNLTTISSNNNIFYFVIDRFDEYYAEDVYDSDPELFDMLDGFTSFKDNIALYGRTFPSVPYLLTDYKFETSLYREQNLKKAYDNNTTLKTLHENGYKIDLYGQNYYDYPIAGNLPDYVENVSTVYEYDVKNPFMLALHMVGLAVYRCSPHLMKPLYSKVNSSSCNSFVIMKDADGYVDYNSDNKKALKLVKGSRFETVEENVFTFMHFEGCHAVNVDYKDGRACPSKKEAKKTKKLVRECFETIKLYINALKAAGEGVYENATIIITGDHATPGKDKEITSSRLTALFVKPSGSAGEKLKFSYAQVAHENLWATIMQSEKIQTEEDYGISLFDIDENDRDRTRKHIWQTWESNSLDEYYYDIKGSGRTFDNWELVATTHADKFLMD